MAVKRRTARAKPGKTSRKHGTKAARTKSKTVRKPAVRDPLDGFIDAAARALDLPVEPDWKPAVAANLRVTLEHAASVEAFALPDDAEPAPVFTA